MERELAVVTATSPAADRSGEALLGLLRVAGWQVRIAGSGNRHLAIARRDGTTLRVLAETRAEAVLDVFEAAIKIGRAVRTAAAA